MMFLKLEYQIEFHLTKEGKEKSLNQQWTSNLSELFQECKD